MSRPLVHNPLLSSVVASFADAAVALDEASRVLATNEAFANWVGAERGGLLGALFDQWDDPRPGNLRVRARLMARERSHLPFDVRLRGADGRYRDGQASLSVLPEPLGPCFLVVIRPREYVDCSPLERLREAELRRSELRLESLATQLALSVTVFGFDKPDGEPEVRAWTSHSSLPRQDAVPNESARALALHVWRTGLQARKGRTSAWRLSTGEVMVVDHQDAETNTLLDYGPVVVFAVDVDGNILYASPAAATLFCLARESLVGKGVDALGLQPISVCGETPLSLLDAVLQGQCLQDAPFVFSRVTGETVRLRVVGEPAFQLASALAYVITLVDITELGVLRERAASLAQALDQAQRLGDIGDWLLHPSDGSLSLSLAAARMHGLSHKAEPVPAATFVQSIYVGDRAAWASALARAKREPGVARVEYHVPLANGNLRTLVCEIVHERKERESSPKITAIIRDVSEVRAATIARTEALAAIESASRAKSEFLAMMSHELRTPLNAVRGFSELIVSSATDELSRTYARFITQGADDLTEIIQDILDLAAIEAGELQLEPAAFELWDIIGEVSRTHGQRASRRGLALVSDVSPNVPPVITADAKRIRQVISNLVENAIKFTEKGRVSVHVEPVVLDQGPALLWKVCDTGIGIPASQIAAIFDPFTQVDSSLTRRFEGIGLGLSISKRLVEAMGGSISVNSVVGRGSTFQIVIPYLPTPGYPLVEELSQSLSPSLSPPLSRDDSAEDTQRRKTVLVVEDDPTNTALVVELLRRLPVDVTVLDNGIRALETANARAFDIILMDVQLPGLNGLDITRHIRADGGPNQRTLIVGVSAHAMEKHISDAHAAGMNHYIPKPLRPLRFLESLRGWLQLAESDLRLPSTAPAS